MKPEVILLLKKLLCRKKSVIDKILSAIEIADDAQLSQIIQAMIRRYRSLHPKWDVFFLSLPKAKEERKQQLE